jgi:hypothetical protein
MMGKKRFTLERNRLWECRCGVKFGFGGRGDSAVILEEVGDTQIHL